MKLYCRKCETELKFLSKDRNTSSEFCEINGQTIRYHCNECSKIIEDNMKQEMFIEEYNGHSIYCKDGRYVPYWGCRYYFKTLEECKLRIDNRYALINKEDFMILNNLLH